MRITISNEIDKEILKIMLSEEEFHNFAQSRFLPTQKVVLNFYNDSEYIGFVEFEIKSANRNGYVTYLVLPENRGKGYGKEMLRKAVDFAFSNLNLFRITAEVYEYNKRSIGLLESLGFELEGRLRKAKYYNGKYWDILVFGKRRDS
ncbi:acetyltransferase, ribosomal protein N-acetylase [Fervidobacterium pennivorans DSM 9078]|uniref:Acetyltransferase, ribosomal protein N-acetylase n=1 Tax=Fervidobacterium pennivorans (strain DSM 9078 / Ven5) TaxID=771875 RepID=H9UBC0_FERPD|nr:GNAT family protein [Fervidobacterium pennivorans]AFG34813.1 acetyltransferase, ribosomal protein N-acetylase [Fervidobacterium pennivorans DSM 9078]